MKTIGRIKNDQMIPGIRYPLKGIPTHTGKRRIPRNKTNPRPHKKKPGDDPPKGKDISIRTSSAPWQIIYGSYRIGGVWTFAHNVENGGYLHCVITLAGSYISAVDQMYVNEDRINFPSGPLGWADGGYRPDGSFTNVYNNRIFANLSNGDVDQAANAHLVAQSAALFPGLWTTDHRQRGLAHIYHILQYSNDAFPDGLPDLSYEVRGCSVYDPRLDEIVYSNNAALCIADFLTNTRFGCSIPWEKIDLDNLSDAADVCDEEVLKLDGSTELRYRIDTLFTSDETKQSILEQMMTAMGGSISIENGKYKFWPATWRTPVVDLDETDLRSDISIKVLPSRQDSFNAVRGQYSGPQTKWQVTDFPPIKNTYYKELDNGEEVFADTNYPCTISSTACQRLAKIELEKMRQGLEVRATWGLKAFAAEAPENITLTIARYGWTAKPFEVVESELVLDSQGSSPELAVELLLRETASGVFDWNQGLETTVDIAPNTNLPNPYVVPSITNLVLESGTDQLYIRADGTVFSRIRVQWDAFSSTFVSSNGFVEIQYKRSDASEWIPSTPIPAENSFAYILDVQDGQYYDVRVRAKNGLGIAGAWVQLSNHLVVGKTEPPSDVANFYGAIGDYEVRFKWDAVPDLDISHYELRLADYTLDWDSAEFIAEVRGTQYVYPISLTAQYRFLLKAVDTSGNKSLNAASLAINITVPSAVTITSQFVGENVRLQWTQSTGLFAVDDYEIRYGNDFDLSILVARIKGTSLNVKANWSGLRRFWVVAYDVAGNRGDLAFRDIYVYPPFAVPNLTAQIIDNNVLLRWGKSTGGSLPVQAYRVYKGASLSGAELIGETAGTFTAYFELYAGDYTYWVVPYDTAGNVGTAASVGAHVDEPPDFELLLDVILYPQDADVLANIRNELVAIPPEILDEPPLPGTEQPGEVFGAMLTGNTLSGA